MGCNVEGPGDGGVPGSPPGGTTGGTALCCTCPADGDVSTNGNTEYVPTTWRAASYSRLNKCHIDIQRTTSGGTVTITKKFKLSYAAGATAASDAATVTSAISSAMTSWQSAASGHKIKIEQPTCDPQELTIRFVSSIVTSGEDVSVSVDGTAAPTPPAAGLRSAVSHGTDMTFYLNGVGNVSWTMIHETGHTFGLSDEYTYNRTSATPAPSLTYKAADDPDQTVTLTTSTIPVATGNFGFDKATVMGKNGNTTYPKYLFHWIAIEVQNILAANATPASVYVT